jgi:superoxide dismutase, Cu-Zn family
VNQHVKRTWSIAAGIAVSALLLSAPVASAQAVTSASARLIGPDGNAVGTALLTQTATGVRISVQASGLTPGEHGIHVHAVGQCDPPAFTSAGGHFNPLNRQHGLQNPQGPHAGDLPNLMAPASGMANYVTTTDRITLGPGPISIFDADGSAIVIHANADDHRTDPTGESGGRVACGVIVQGAAALPATGSAVPAGPTVPAAALALIPAGLATLGLAFARRFRRA